MLPEFCVADLELAISKESIYCTSLRYWVGGARRVLVSCLSSSANFLLYFFYYSQFCIFLLSFRLYFCCDVESDRSISLQTIQCLYFYLSWCKFCQIFLVDGGVGGANIQLTAADQLCYTDGQFQQYREQRQLVSLIQLGRYLQPIVKLQRYPIQAVMLCFVLFYCSQTYYIFEFYEFWGHSIYWVSTAIAKQAPMMQSILVICMKQDEQSSILLLSSYSIDSAMKIGQRSNSTCTSVYLTNCLFQGVRFRQAQQQIWLLSAYPQYNFLNCSLN